MLHFTKKRDAAAHVSRNMATDKRSIKFVILPHPIITGYQLAASVRAILLICIDAVY